MEVKALLVNCLLLCFVINHGQVTERKNRLLHRKKRYLTFPEGSNFVMTMSVVKSVMVRAPRGTNMLGECDVPFKLPSDTRIFRKYRRQHSRQRREVFTQFATALEGYGLNGDACIKRMICEAAAYMPLKGESLVKDLLSAVFKPEADGIHMNYCRNNATLLSECDLPLWEFMAAPSVST